MIKKLVLAAVLVVAVPLSFGSSSAAACKTWKAKNPQSHHRAGPVDVVGGKGYGSGYHGSQYYSSTLARGDQKRRAAEGGYVQYKAGATIIEVNFFGPFDETDNAHFYDTAYGMCVSQGSTKVDSGEKCIKTSQYLLRRPGGGWTPCGGY